MKEFLRHNRFLFGLFAIIIVFVAVKISYLSLPYYWDEAWVYGPAVRTMESTGLGILPNALPPELSRGHPLLFHFLSASWMRIFGTSVTASHVFPLLASIVLLIVVYFFGKIIFQSEKIGFTAAFVLALQPIFLAQSGLLLPEVLLALFTLLPIYFYLGKQTVLYLIACTLALFTKETGVVIIANLLLCNFLFTLSNQELGKWKIFLTNSLLIALPIVPFLAFFLIQKMTYGWFFFPEHISLIIDSPTKVLNQLERFAAYFFIYQGRNLLTFSSVIALLFAYFKGKQIENKYAIAMVVLLVQIIVGLLFCSLNFYSDRYVMFMIPLLALLFSYSSYKAFEFKWVPLIAIVVVAGLQWPIIQQRSNCDHNLGYADAVITHQQALDFLQNENLREKIIYASFLTIGYFQYPYEGYVSEDNKLMNMRGEFSDEIEYAVFSNREEEEIYQRLKKEGKLPKSFGKVRKSSGLDGDL